jgi:hypothetical protein
MRERQGRRERGGKKVKGTVKMNRRLQQEKGRGK